MPESPDRAALDATANRIHSAAIHLLRHVARVDAESGLSAARLSALSVLVYGGPITMTALADAERVSPGTITSTVTGLEEAGLARRQRKTGDARRVVVEATPSGRRLMDAAQARRIGVLVAGLRGRTEAQRAAIEVAAAAIEDMLTEDVLAEGE